jgi:hypothetical protein
MRYPEFYKLKAITPVGLPFLPFVFKILNKKRRVLSARLSGESTIDLSLPPFLLHIHTHTHKYIYLHTHTYRTVPDPRALKILGEFSPLVEIGAGNG